MTVGNKNIDDVKRELENKQTKSINDVIEYFSWMFPEGKTDYVEGFTDNQGKLITYKSEKGMNRSFFRKYHLIETGKVKVFLNEHPELQEYFKLKYEYAKQSYKYFMEFMDSLLDSIKGFVPDREQTKLCNRYSHYFPWFWYKLKKPQYIDRPITISVFVSYQSLSVELELDADASNQSDYSSFNKHMEEPLDDGLSYVAEPKDNKKAIEIQNKIDDNQDLSNETIPDGVRIKIVKKLEIANDKKDDDYKKEIIGGIEQLIKYYDKTGLAESTFMKKFRLHQSIDKLSKNIILYGPPGTGKTYNTTKLAVWLCNKGKFGNIDPDKYDAVMEQYRDFIKCGQIKFVTFHQSYGYEDFIEGIRPRLISSDNGDNESNIKYQIEDGVFKVFCDSARNDKDNNYVFIIDEINRGNISKIFGELITLIEDSKREGTTEAISAILPYSKIEFSVPKNVYIIGTMNTADRSIAMLDTALRRRFSFIEMLPYTGVVDGIKIGNIDVSKMLETVNERIEVLYDREHTIGHAFFLGLENEKSVEELASIFENNVMPLLQEYFYDDYEKINWVLGGTVNKPCGFLTAKKISPNPFQSESGIIYRIADHSAFTKQDNYINIYGKAPKENDEFEEDVESANDVDNVSGQSTDAPASN